MIKKFGITVLALCIALVLITLLATSLVSADELTTADATYVPPENCANNIPDPNPYPYPIPVECGFLPTILNFNQLVEKITP